MQTLVSTFKSDHP